MTGSVIAALVCLAGVVVLACYTPPACSRCGSLSTKVVRDRSWGDRLSCNACGHAEWL